MEKQNVLVTGGAGFIGSHLVSRLVEQGHAVTVLDDLSTGKDSNIGHLIRSGSVEFRQGGIDDESLLHETCTGKAWVFHLAAMASVPQSIEQPLTCHEINATGTLKVLTAARDEGVGKVVFASSCAVYGDTETLPVSESVLPVPLSPYAVSKLVGEQYCRVFTRLYGLPTASMRFFNIFGPGQNPDSPYSAVIPLFIRKALANEPIMVDGDGEQTRDFIFVKDAVDACITAARTEATGEYNVGNGFPVTVNRLVQLILKLSENETAVRHRNARPGDIRHSYADISRLTGTGFRPGFSLEQGLEAVIAAMRG